jgi:hypothetical protein
MERIAFDFVYRAALRLVARERVLPTSDLLKPSGMQFMQLMRQQSGRDQLRSGAALAFRFLRLERPEQ